MDKYELFISFLKKEKAYKKYMIEFRSFRNNQSLKKFVKGINTWHFVLATFPWPDNYINYWHNIHKRWIRYHENRNKAHKVPLFYSE
jgi:hypothetical protein